MNSEYYRFFWIAPVIVLVPYLFTKLLFNAVDRRSKAALAALILCICLVSGNFVYKDGIRFASNIYKMPDELMEISAIIHADSTAAYPKAFLEYEYNMQMRQYDPKLQLTIDREDYMNAVSLPYTEEMLEDEAHPQYRLLASLVRLQPVDREAFIDALEATKTEYVVLSKGNPRDTFLMSAGLKKIAETESHAVYRYEVKEPYDFELVDYSVVY